MHQRWRTLLTMVALLAVAAAGCGGETAAQPTAQEAEDAAEEATADEPAMEATADEPAMEATAEDGVQADAGAATVAVADSELGELLVDGEGLTLYAFLPDEQSTSTCYDSCAANWPPLTGAAEAGPGVDEALLATVDRDDGTAQATYDGWPLYYFAGDSAPGDTNGQGVGDNWYVIAPDGEIVSDAAGAAATTGSAGGGADEDY